MTTMSFLLRSLFKWPFLTFRDLSVDLLQMIPDNHVLLAKLCSLCPGSVTEINQLHERVSAKSSLCCIPEGILPSVCFSADQLTACVPCLSRQCGLPSSEECQTLAGAALEQGDLLSAVKFHLLGSEPEAALHIGIEHVKGTDEACALDGAPAAHQQLNPSSFTHFYHH